MISAIILAGGRGKRMGADVSKQFIHINDKPLIYYTLKRFINCTLIDRVVLVLPKNEIEYCKNEILNKYSLKVDYIVEGGAERQDSVYNGLKVLNNTDIVLIHDGARPFVTDEIIEKSIKCAKKYNCAIVGVPVKDTIKIVNENNDVCDTPNRNTLWSIQTPQVFDYSLIMNAHEKAKADEYYGTDDSMLMEYLGYNVKVVEGSYNNIKITTPEDLKIAEEILR